MKTASIIRTDLTTIRSFQESRLNSGCSVVLEGVLVFMVTETVGKKKKDEGKKKRKSKKTSMILMLINYIRCRGVSMNSL